MRHYSKIRSVIILCRLIEHAQTKANEASEKMNKFNSISKYERSKLVDQKLEKEARKYFITTKTIF